MRTFCNLALASVVSLAASTTHAQGNYSNAYELEKYCNTFAEAAETDFGIKRLSASMNLSDDREGRERQAREMFENGDNLKMRLFSINYVYTRATSEHDAHMATWAYCQDLVRAPKRKSRAK